MNFYLSKPLDLDYLARVLRQHCVAPAEANAKACTFAPSVVGQSAAEKDFDAELLLRRLMDDRELAQVVVDAFLVNGPVQMDMLQGYVAERDVPGVRMQAHSLKGAAASISAPRLVRILNSLENAAEEGRTELWPDLLGNAREAHVQLNTALRCHTWTGNTSHAAVMD